MIADIDKRLQWLTSKQRELAFEAKNKGNIHYKHFKLMYSSKENWERAINKLVDFSIVRPDKLNPNLFHYIPPIDFNVQRTLTKDEAKKEVENKLKDIGTAK